MQGHMEGWQVGAGSTSPSASSFIVGEEQAAERSVLYFRAVSKVLQKRVEIQGVANRCAGSSLTQQRSPHFSRSL